MEACYSSHYWGRTFSSMGHDVGLIPAQHVTPFVRGNKNDTNDTLAIFEASERPFIRFVPIKTQAQQEILMLHRLRERLLKNRTSASNPLAKLPPIETDKNLPLEVVTDELLVFLENL